jgi:hypothetical protein
MAAHSSENAISLARQLVNFAQELAPFHSTFDGDFWTSTILT